MKNLIIVFFAFLSLTLQSQTVYTSFAGYGTVDTVIGTGPVFTLRISSFVGNPRFEPDGQYFASDITTGDVVWVNCTRLPITLVGVTSASSMTITVTAPSADWALGISGPVTNQRVAVVSENTGLPFLPQTGDGNSGLLSGISSDLYTCMFNHYQKALLTIYNPVNEIIDYVGIVNVAPATDPTLYTGQLWKNSVGQIYRSNGTAWINDGFTLNTSTEFAGTGTLVTPLKLAQQSAVVGQTLKWDGLKWTPANDNIGSVVTANLTGTPKVTVTNGIGAVLGASDVVLDVNEASLNSGLIPIIDVGNYFPNDNVNAALQVLGAAAQPGVTKLGPSTAPSGPTGGLISNDTLYLAPADDIYKGVVRLAGDLDVPANAPIVTGLYGRDLVSTAPTDGQVYAWNTALNKWVPTTPSSGVGVTDLSIANRTASNFDVVSSTGVDATLPFVTTTLAGVMEAGDKVKLDSLNNQTVSAGTGISVVKTGQNYQVTNTGDLSNTNELQTINYSAPTITLSNGGGSFNIPQGTVTTVSATPSNGITATVNTPGTTPELVLGLGAITPTSVNASGTVAGSNLSGTNTGDNSPNSLYSGLVTNQPANLSVTGTASPLTLNSSDGTDVTVSGGTGIGLVGTSSSIQIINSLPENTTILDGTTIDLTQIGDQITAEIKQQGATSGQVLSWDGTNWSPSSPSSGVTDLSVSNRTTTTLDVLSSTGADATLPFATNLLAGLLIADDKTKLDNITVTSPVNLNTLATNSHVPVTVSGETYITLAGQTLTANQITSSNITNGTILYADINQNGATTNQSFRWNGSAWVNYTTLTSLDVTQGLTNVGLDFNGGTSFGTIILSANASRAGVLTAALWSKLDTLNNQRVLAGTGIGVVKVGQNYTVTNTSPDQTVTIAGASGTYPNFTLPTIDGSETKVNSGTNISVTGSGTIASPYVVNNSAPEATTVTDGTTINLTKTGNDITAELQQQSATTGQVLKWNGTQWIPQNDNVGSVTTNNLVSTSRTIVTNGTGAILGASPVTVDVDESGLNPTNIPIADTGGYFSPDNINAALQQLGANNHSPLTVTDGTIIDFTLTGQNLTATIISGSITTTQITDGTIGLADLNQMGATSGQSLRWNGTAWEVFTPNAGTLTGLTNGAGISITGSAPNLTVTNTGVLVEVDGSISNELQTLGVASNTVTLSNSGGSFTIAGAGGITPSTSGTTITLTGTASDGSETKVNSGTSINVTGLGTIASPYVINNTAPNIVETATATPATAVAPLVGTNVQAQLNELGAKTHDAVTVTDNAKINFTLTGQDITANIITGSITNTDLAASGAITNQVLAFNGTNWVPTTPSSGITDLSVSNRTTTTLDVLSNTGTDATLPAATNLLAGLMISADKAKSDFITVTQAVDLDAIESSSHAPVTKTGANYLTLSGQALTANLIEANDLSSMGASSDQVMKWNGATWVPTDQTATVAIPNQEITFGTGSGITSDTSYRYNSMDRTITTTREVNAEKPFVLHRYKDVSNGKTVLYKMQTLNQTNYGHNGVDFSLIARNFPIGNAAYGRTGNHVFAYGFNLDRPITTLSSLGEYFETDFTQEIFGQTKGSVEWHLEQRDTNNVAHRILTHRGAHDGSLGDFGFATDALYFTKFSTVGNYWLEINRMTKKFDIVDTLNFRFQRPMTGIPFLQFKSNDNSRHWSVFTNDSQDRLVLCPENNDLYLKNRNMIFEAESTITAEGGDGLNFGKIGNGTPITFTANGYTAFRMRNQTSGFFTFGIANYSGSDNFQFNAPNGNAGLSVHGNVSNGLLNLKTTTVGIGAEGAARLHLYQNTNNLAGGIRLTSTTDANGGFFVGSDNKFNIVGRTLTPAIVIDALDVSVPSLAGTGNRLTQANSAGVLQPTTLDPSAIVVSAVNGLTSTSGVIKLGATPLTENTTISKTANETLSFNLDTKQTGQRVVGATSIKTIEYPSSTLQMATSAAVGAIVIKLNQASTNYADVKLHINTVATKINVNPVTSNSFLNMDIEFGALLTAASNNLSAKWSYSQNYPELEFALTNKLMVRLAKEASGNYVFIVGDISDTWGGAFNASGNFNALIERINLLDNFGYNIDGARPTMAIETSLSAYTILATENANPYNVFTTTTRPVTQEKGYTYFDADKQVMMVFNGIQYEPFGDATPLLSSNSVIRFDRLREYGSVLAPVSGDITVDFNVNNVVRSQLMFHKSATTPLFPSNAIIDGIYFTDTSTINVIEAEYRGVNQIFFKINK